MFTLTPEYFDGITITRFVGDMTLPHAVALRQQLEATLKKSKPKDVVLDLAGVQSIDNSGLGALVGASTQGRSWGKRLMLYNIMPLVAQKLHDAEIAGFFPVLEDESDVKSRQSNKKFISNHRV